MTTNKILTKNNKIFKNIELLLLSLSTIFVLIVILSNPKRYNTSVLQGLTMFLTCVLPGLFPFMFFTKLLSSFGLIEKLSSRLEKPTRLLFNTSPISSYVLLISAISGYPVGAKLISDLYLSNSISQSDAKKMCSFCTTSGPLFVIGTVGAVMVGNITVGIVIYISHILASVMCGITLRGKSQQSQKISSVVPLHRPDNLLSKTMLDTVQNILLVGGYITIFFLISDIIFDTKIATVVAYPLEKFLSLFGISGLSNGIVGGLLEVTRGCKILSAFTGIWPICFAASLISFGGLSITIQSMAYLSRCKIKARYFVFVKCVHAIFTFFICLGLCKLFIV